MHYFSFITRCGGKALHACNGNNNASTEPVLSLYHVYFPFSVIHAGHWHFPGVSETPFPSEKLLPRIPAHYTSVIHLRRFLQILYRYVISIHQIAGCFRAGAAYIYLFFKHHKTHAV